MVLMLIQECISKKLKIWYINLLIILNIINIAMNTGRRLSFA